MDITYPQLICHLLNLSLPVNKSDSHRPHQDPPYASVDAWLFGDFMIAIDFGGHRFGLIVYITVMTEISKLPV